ncbi:Kinesin-like protein KIN-7E [Linum grandiflorum]
MGSIGAESMQKLEKMQQTVASAREEKILVLVRLRPLSDKEILGDEVADWECINDTTVLYRNTLREGSTFPSAYSFDRVYRGDCSTRQVYEDGTREVALSVVNGINASIFAYGQTSSGKTYTMNGITEYAVADIFDYINRHEERAFVLKFSAIEIYNEAIRDLLTADNTSLRLLDDPDKGTVVEKATEEILKDWNHLKELLSFCEAQRRVGETFLNEKSSRSHQILRLTIESSAREFLGKENSTTLSATVNFVDLAGSERASQSQSSGARLKEGCHINRSLLTLGTVIRKLSKGRNGHINYRDSKLTRLLQPALGGNARTAIVCTLSPARSHVEQTRNTLLFACCAKEVTTKAQVNVVMSDKALVKHLQRELARLESELRTPTPASTTCDYPTLLRKRDLQIQKMEKEIKDLTKQRDLAESRIQDLLQMIRQDQDSRRTSEISQNPNQQERGRWGNDCSVSESYPPINGGVSRLYGSQFDGDSGSNHLRDSLDYHSDATSSLMPMGKKIMGSGTRFDTAEDDEYCKEVQCIEMGETTTVHNNAEHRSISNGDIEEHQEVTTPRNVSDERLHHPHRSIDPLVSSPSTTEGPSPWPRAPDGSSSTLGDSTPPNGFERKYAGRPESVRRRFPPITYDAEAPRLMRNNSHSSIESAATDDFRSQGVAAADEDIPTVENFVAGLKEMAKQEYQKQHADNPETDETSEERKKKGTVKDIGLDAMLDNELTAPDSPLKFERQQRRIIELWHTCNVSLVHRTYFFLLFKGDPLDSIYMEVELRRLSFLEETFSPASYGIGSGQSLTMISSMKTLQRERVMLSKLMQKRLSGEERNRLYRKWGIELNSKRRKLQLANRLWSNPKDGNHAAESAGVVAKLVRFAEQGQALKGMFGLSFTPPSANMKSLSWSYSK